MTNIAIASQWRMANAVLTSGPSAPSGPASNLIIREPSRACILTDDSQFYVVCDLGAAMAIRLIAPLYVSASSSCRWRVRAAQTKENLTGWATWNPADRGANVVLSNGNKTAFTDVETTGAVRATAGMDVVNEARYFEFEATVVGGVSTTTIAVGIANSSRAISVPSSSASNVRTYTSLGWRAGGGSNSTYGSVWNDGSPTRIGVAIKSGSIWFAQISGGVTTWQGGGDPVGGTNPAFSGLTGTWYPYATDGSATRSLTADLIADPAGMLGTVPAGFEAGFPAVGYDSGWMDFATGEDGLDHRRGYKHDWLIPAAAQTYRWWRIDFDDADAENGQLIIGNLVLDNPFIPSQLNYSHASQEPWLFDPSRKPTAVAGQRDPLNRRPYFIADVVLEYVTRAEAKGTIGTLTQKVGTTEPVLAIFNPDETDFRQSMAIFGLIDELRPLVVPFAEIYQTRMRIEELIP